MLLVGDESRGTITLRPPAATRLGGSSLHETSRSLLERLRLQPDSGSWQRLVDLYTPLIQRWLRQCGVPTGEVDDLVQDVLGVVVRKMPEFEHSQQRGGLSSLVADHCAQPHQRVLAFAAHTLR